MFWKTKEAAPAAPPTENILIDELLRERRRDRRASIVKSAFFLLAALAYVWWMTIFFGVGNQSPISKDFAAVVKINGMIGPGKEASYEALAPVLKQAFEHPHSAGVVLRINSPGGTPVQASLIHELILDLKQKHNKKVLAVGEDMMTSGAYLIATAADTLIVNKSTVSGSIGVISAGFGFSELMEKLGVERRVNTAGKSKNLLDPFSPVSDEGLAKQKELLEGIHTHFKDIVLAQRGDKLQLDTPELFEGSVWLGEKAVEIGLVDELGSLNNAVEAHLGVTETRTLSRRKPIMESLIENAGVKAMQSILDVSLQPQLLP